MCSVYMFLCAAVLMANTPNSHNLPKHKLPIKRRVDRKTKLWLEGRQACVVAICICICTCICFAVCRRLVPARKACRIEWRGRPQTRHSYFFFFFLFFFFLQIQIFFIFCSIQFNDKMRLMLCTDICSETLPPLR